ncbi:flagellar basal body P-ring formation protein FlgA [Shewanella sp. D64]|uniref:flagellar basal body P-ring formation chaperone FlgA n=1 Tax=unclassified Shewanella TaxID=196818 RepID=UPI0022BA562A|nr:MULTISPECIES: flagellar basal body P-ring formation chaperone FlgA [unclassified Shewanella]MEC4726535.1 flagellar basal body P-ring formation protein FlgA [Shewanella sp. D64]MEC4737424.1 flagellar basal body P-ring formation protein FlgA [Shewanella sp. E94]WBJ98135.1 flagellar basal body P-ring formation protein FlgA [Shewanella sp. MTB7]
MKIKNILILFTVFFSIPSFGASQASIPSLSAISKLAIEVIEKKINVADGAKIKITPQSLDSRLTPPLCLPPIKAELATNRAIKRTNTVKISCDSPQLDYPWQIFLSVRVDILYPVVVARETLGPGDLLSSGDVSVQYVDQTYLRGQQFDTVEQVIGTRVKRRIPPNQPIFSNNLCFVCKGDIVSIFARSRTLVIKTVGEALRDGNLGDRIRIKNTNSNKSLHATVIGVGEVEVRM